jgi:hypothetical protein
MVQRRSSDATDSKVQRSKKQNHQKLLKKCFKEIFSCIFSHQQDSKTSVSHSILSSNKLKSLTRPRTKRKESFK